MPKSNHSRKGINRKRWICPNHHASARTIVGKPCPICGQKVSEQQKAS